MDRRKFVTRMIGAGAAAVLLPKLQPKQSNPIEAEVASPVDTQRYMRDIGPIDVQIRMNQMDAQLMKHLRSYYG